MIGKYLNIEILKYALGLTLGAWCLLFVAPHAIAADGFTALAPIPGLTDAANTSVVNSTSLANFFNNLYKYLIGLAAVLAIIQITWSGIRIALNQDNVSTITDSKGHIAQAILGLVLVLSPVIVFSIINPSILNLSLNLPPLETKTEVPAGAATRTPGCTPHAANGPYLERATCSSQSAAENYKCQNGLTLTIPHPCTTTDPKNTTACANIEVNVYCTGKLIDVQYHTVNFLGITSVYGKAVPSDEQAEKTYISGCIANGGITPVPSLSASFTCPTDRGIPDYSIASQDKFKCKNATFVCRP